MHTSTYLYYLVLPFYFQRNPYLLLQQSLLIIRLLFLLDDLKHLHLATFSHLRQHWFLHARFRYPFHRCLFYYYLHRLHQLYTSPSNSLDNSTFIASGLTKASSSYHVCSPSTAMFPTRTFSISNPSMFVL